MQAMAHKTGIVAWQAAVMFYVTFGAEPEIF